MNNIKIYNPKGEVVFSHPPKGYYKKELMGDEYVIFSWNDVRIHDIPVGSYIKYKDIKFTLLEPYLPNMTNELQFKYELKFERFSWRKTPLYFIDGDIKESEFAIDGKPAIVLTHVLRSLKDELGEEYTLSIDESLTSSKSFNFQNESIVSALNKIADEWGTEWWLDDNILHLSKCEKGEQEDLIIGDDIKPPSNSENDDYYTRFVVIGGSRNMAQKYEEGVNISTKTTLKLDKTKYPDSAISISDDIRFTKTLVFEDIYPRSFLEISDVRAEIIDYYGEDGQKVQVGTENGEPVYKTYPIYTIQFKDYTLDPSDVLNGLTPQVKFESGILEGRDFDVEIVSSGLRVKYKDEAGIITPNYTLKPNVGDKVVLWNVKMPDKYIKDAQDELEKVALKYINDLKLDNTQYTANTNRVKFDRFLDVGQRVRYVKLGYDETTDGTKELYTLDTRILSFQINLENNREQILVFGNNLVKGNIKELKEDVTNVNDNVALLGEIQNARDTILNVYGRTQQEFSKFVNQFSRMWTFKDIKGYEYAYTPYNVALKGSLVMYAGVDGIATPSLFDAFPHDNKTIKRRADGVYYAVGGGGGISKVSISVNYKEYLPDSNGKITIPDYPSRLSHLTNDVGYTTQQWVENQKYANVSQLPTRVSQLTNDSGYVTSNVVDGYATQSWSNGRFALKSHRHVWGDITNTPTTLLGYGITDAMHDIRTLEDWNNAPSSGFYVNSRNEQNETQPDIGGGKQLIVSMSAPNNWFQIAARLGDGGRYYMRSRHSGALNAWKEIATRDWVLFRNYAVKSTTLDGYGITDGVFNKFKVSNNANSIDSSGFYWNTSKDDSRPYAGSYNPLLSASNGSTSMQLSADVWSQVYYIRSKTSTSWNRWRQLAFTDSNVVSATKLQNTRRIFGQQFNGTQDVKGSASDIIDISMTGKLDGVTKIILKGGKEIYYDSARDAIIIDGDVLATGAVTMFAK